MRTINSPGVQITEIDLSTYAQPQVGTNVFVAGFADQGPVDQVIQISTLTELEDIYGAPKTAPEAYFYENCKQIVQSPGNLYATRLPYGENLGEEFSSQHSALLFPAATGLEVSYTAVSTIQVQSINIVGDDGIESVDFSAGINIETIVKRKDGYTSRGQDETFTLENTKCLKLNGVDTQVLSISTVSVTWEAGEGTPTVVIGKPRQISLRLDEYQDLLNGEYEWADGLGSYDWPVTDGEFDIEPVYDLSESGPQMNDVGFIVINTAKSVNNEKGAGYYVSIADNSNFGPDSNYDSVVGVISLTANQGPKRLDDEIPEPVEYGQVEIPTTRFMVALSAEAAERKQSISRVIETVPKFNFGDDYFADSIVVNVHRVGIPNSQPNMLNISVMESFIGSLDKEKKTVADAGGVQKSFFIEDSVNNTSSRIKLVVNPNLSKYLQWTDPLSENSNPVVQVRVDPGAKYLFANGVFTPTNPGADAKHVGNVAGKLEHALRLVENPDNITLDIVVDAGLSTIHTNNVSGQFDDLKRLDPALTALDNPESDAIASWLEVHNVLNSFATDTRKDCIAIVDPLRQVFLRGGSKTAERRGVSFTEAIYTPLKNLLSLCDSNYTAVYGNWLLGSSVALDRKIWLPASGAVAAMYCKSDAATQPWFAPAGFTRGSLTGVLDLAINPNQKQRDNLYTISVNPIVNFPGEGIVVFGQKTLQLKPTAFDRINVRRLFLSLERSVAKGLKYFVFEPNTAITRTRLLNTISPIFLEAKRTQGVYDYMIVCDERNNTSDSIDRNELIVDIYIKPVKAAEFILVNFIATRTGQEFSELI